MLIVNLVFYRPDKKYYYNKKNFEEFFLANHWRFFMTKNLYNPVLLLFFGQKRQYQSKALEETQFVQMAFFCTHCLPQLEQ